MPSGLALYDECSSHFRNTSVDPCWEQRDSRPESPVQCGGGSSGTPPVETVNNEQSRNNNSEASSNNTSSSGESDDELNKIRSGFDTWLAAFRTSRPHRDVIWRVGKMKKDVAVTQNYCVLLMGFVFVFDHVFAK